MALRLTLKPGERAILSGAVVRNGDARIELFVENDVPVLREPDILGPAAVKTPCDRIYMALQLAYVEPARVTEHLDTYRVLADELLAVAPSCTRLVACVDEQVRSGRFYQALRSARDLRDHERRMMDHVS